MQFRITLGTTNLTELLDSGSTHNFISESTVTRASLMFQPSPGLHSEVANGDQVASGGLCHGLPLYIAGERFQVDGLAIPLGGFDIVLGLRWLRTLRPILWDFDHLHMTFWREGRQITWHGIAASRPTARVTTFTNEELLDTLLLEFEGLFADPIGLPPAHHLDHRIHLQPRSAPVAIQPYRYSHLQKDELERQCSAMLQEGTIHSSSSAFSSPVLLVKKHDGTWRFFVDYRALNDLTVKYTFPIPVVN